MGWDDLRLERRVATFTNRCRCGTHLSVGEPCFEFRGIPEALRGLLRGQAFCTLGCVRAYLLEAMEVLDGEGSPQMISDVHSVYSYLRIMFEMTKTKSAVTIFSLAS